MHFFEGHRMITKSLIMLKIAFNESCCKVLLEAFSLARKTFSSSKSFTFGDFYSIGRVVYYWLKKTFPFTRAKSNLLNWLLLFLFFLVLLLLKICILSWMQK